MKNIPNGITASRILGTVALLIIKPFSVQFLIIYLLCGVSDVLDGMIARKMNCSSKRGQLLDSIADFFMIAVLLFVLIPYYKLPLWTIYWIAIIAALRVVSLVIGLIRYGQLAFLHTYSNKFAGLVLFCFPFLCIISGLHKTSFLVCLIASLSALEELIINTFSKKLQRDITSVFSIGQQEIK